jgi:hypothetical protein
MDSNLKGELGESFVSLLATNTFLSNWCYLNPYDELGDKKEICDLLILFKEYCIIFQIKNYEFKDNHDRYFRKTVDHAVGQIKGAERKLFHLNRDICFKNNENGLIKFDKEKHCKIIRLAIHLGDGVQYQNIGRLTKKNQDFIHVIGKEDFEYLMKELNTISDFVDYLSARESFATKIDKVAVFGKEKDFLGLYLRIKPRFNEFVKENEGKLLLLDLENSWEDFEIERTDNEEVVLEVESLICDWVQKDLILNESSRGVAEDLMSLNRHERRLFAVSFLNFSHTYLNKGHSTIIRRHIVLNDIGFVFFFYPKDITGENLQQLMFIAAEGFSYFTNYEITKTIVVGVSEKDKISFTLADLSDSKHFMTEELKKILNYLGWFQDDKLVYFDIDINRKLPPH